MNVVADQKMLFNQDSKEHSYVTQGLIIADYKLFMGSCVMQCFVSYALRLFIQKKILHMVHAYKI